VALHLLIWLGRAPGLTGFGLALLLTYTVHAALWAGAAAWLARRKGFAASLRHRLWKMALLGPLVSTALAAAIPASSGYGRGPRQHLHEVTVLSLAGAPAVATTLDEQGVAGAAIGGQVLGALCVLAPALGLLRFTAAAWRLRRRLRGRRDVRDPRMLQPFERLRARLGLRRARLTESAEIGSPLVIGTGEVCVPEGPLAGLTDAQIEAVLAHELAHLERDDGIWFPAVGLLQSVLWMQPLNHGVAARFRQTAELACDDRAVALTGDGLSLARALVHVAAGGAETRRPAMLPAMARSGEALRGRVKRLVAGEDRAGSATNPAARRWASACLALVGMATVGLSVHAAPPPASPVVEHANPDAADVPATTAPPDTVAMNDEMGALLRRERELEAQLASTLAHAGAEGPAGEAAVRVIELRQELRHARATEAWLERRFVDAWTAWELSERSRKRTATMSDTL